MVSTVTRARAKAFGEARRLDRELAAAWDALQGVRDGDFDHLFPDVETKARVLADLKGQRNYWLEARLRADPDIVELPDGRFAHIDVARREGMTPKQ